MKREISKEQYEHLLEANLKAIHESINNSNNMYKIQQEIFWIFSDFFENICYLLHYNSIYIQNYIVKYLKNKKINFRIDKMEKIKKNYKLELKDFEAGKKFAKYWWQKNKNRILALEIKNQKNHELKNFLKK